MSNRIPSTAIGGLSPDAFSSMFQAISGLRNRRALIAMVGCMFAGVLARRRVATADVATAGAAPQVEPPPVGRIALDAAGAARRRCRIDPVIRHILSLRYAGVSGCPKLRRTSSAARWPAKSAPCTVA